MRTRSLKVTPFHASSKQGAEARIINARQYSPRGEYTPRGSGSQRCSTAEDVPARRMTVEVVEPGPAAGDDREGTGRPRLGDVLCVWLCVCISTLCCATMLGRTRRHR
jgi:hypothetical protein